MVAAGDILHALTEAPEELRAFVPQWGTLFVDLQQTPPERLTGLGEAALLALRALQAVDAPKEELALALREVAARLDRFPGRRGPGFARRWCTCISLSGTSGMRRIRRTFLQSWTIRLSGMKASVRRRK